MYEFRPMTADDLPLVRHWLGEAHVVKWWGAPDQQFDLVKGDLDEPAMHQFIVARDARPFIGEADMLDRGHGSVFIRSFVDSLLTAGTPRVVTDPDPANARAIRAYEKAGFRKDRLVDTSDGPALLMVRNA
jgi:aminoglycoside 6'-N-acetyltransferase